MEDIKQRRLLNLSLSRLLSVLCTFSLTREKEVQPSILALWESIRTSQSLNNVSYSVLSDLCLDTRCMDELESSLALRGLLLDV